MANTCLFSFKASQIPMFIIFLFLLPLFGQDQKAQERTIFELSCSAVCPNPVQRCGACQVTLQGGCRPAALKQHSSVSWSTSNGSTWMVQFQGKSPCLEKKFDPQHPVCELSGSPGIYKYLAGIAGCKRTIKGTFTVIR